MTEPILPPLKPLPIKDRISVVYVEKGNLDVLNGAFVVVDKTGVRTHLPVGSVACLMLEPGTRVCVLPFADYFTHRREIRTYSVTRVC